MNNETLIFMGRSGSGKGTQITLLKDLIEKKNPGTDILHFESGSHFRSFIKGDGYTSERMRDIIAAGDLAPDFITEWLLVDDLVQNLTTEKMLILDGFPRTINQALTLDSAMDYYKRDRVTVIHVEVSEDEVRRRMLDRGRADDKDLEVINKRISWYNDNVLPVLHHFEKLEQYNVIHVNGELPINEVHAEVIQKLNY